MSATRTHRRAVLAFFLLAAAAVVACDARVTGPVPVAPAQVPPAAIEGDTTGCLRGWVIIAGHYVCVEDL